LADSPKGKGENDPSQGFRAREKKGHYDAAVNFRAQIKKSGRGKRSGEDRRKTSPRRASRASQRKAEDTPVFAVQRKEWREGGGKGGEKISRLSGSNNPFKC